MHNRCVVCIIGTWFCLMFDTCIYVNLLWYLVYKELDLFQLDVSGECEVSYTKSGSSITKNKQKCQNLEIAGQFINPNKVWL